MKRIIGELSSFIVIALSLILLYPIDVNALSQQTSYVNIKSENQSLTVGKLSFSNIIFKNYSATSTLSFGLTGVVTNDSDKTIYYVSNIYYYDSNYKLIAQGYNSGTANAGTSDFNQMSNLSILKGRDVEEIQYYRLLIDTVDNSSTEPNTNSTIPSQNYQYNHYDYVIDRYDVNIIVNENNTLDITETITAYFNVAKHGIFRTIPLKNTITRLDGSTSKNRTQVTNLSVNSEYTTSKKNGNYEIKIGSIDRTLTGEQTYVIKYTYNLGKDPVKDYDELYYDIIGDGWDTVIGNVTFTVVMPKEFDSSKLGFSSGKTGSTDNSYVKYNVSGNKITGKYDGILNMGEALTIRCELDEGYFVGAGLMIDIKDYLPFLIPIVFLGIALLLWYWFGRDERVIETVEFYPPEGFNSLEVGFLYKGEADNRDVTSLLIYLANRGYIKIAEIENRSLFSKSKGFKITKLKEYDGDNINERIFLNGLFIKQFNIKSLFAIENDKDENNINEVTSLDLYDRFYLTMRKILSNINTKENKNKIFAKSASNKTIFIILMIIATYCSITIPPVLAYGEPGTIIFALLFPGLGFTVMFNFLFNSKKTMVYVNGRNTASSIIEKLFILVWGGMFAGIPWVSFVLVPLLQDSIYLIGYIVGVACIIGMVIILKYLPKRTPYGNEILGKLKGFKNFLETAEKDKLEAMVMQNPTYFYDILPYTYVLGVSDKWIKKFETISLQAPNWYDSPNAFDMVNFETFMNNTMVSAQSAMSSSPSSSSSSGGSSSGGSSGGGSSGGGSGGGGGGSW